MSINKRLHVGRQLQTRSHSFASLILPGWSGASAVMITIFPALSISMRAICTPAAVTALTALVTSCCRNVDGARALLTTRHLMQLNHNCIYNRMVMRCRAMQPIQVRPKGLRGHVFQPTRCDAVPARVGG